MASLPGVFRPDLPKVVHAPSRPACHQLQQELAPVCVLSPGQGGLDSGRACHGRTLTVIPSLLTH